MQGKPPDARRAEASASKLSRTPPNAGHCGQRSGECSGATRRTGSSRDSRSAPTESRGGLQVCTNRIKGRPADTSEPSAPTTLLPPSDLAPSRLTHHALDLRSHGKLRTPRLSLIPVRLTQGLLYTDRWPSPTPSFETVSFRLLIPARSRTERNLPALTPG